MEVEKARHELELQETRLKQDVESLKQQLAQMEVETQRSLQNQKLAHEENLGRLKQEKVRADGVGSPCSMGIKTPHQMMHKACFYEGE